MHIEELSIPGVLLIEPQVFTDQRGWFSECFNQAKLDEHLGYSLNFVQDNHSYSKRNVLRGLHYQIMRPQDKLVRVISGSIMDVVVDLRTTSSTFGMAISVILSAENHRQLLVPKGLAHGFVVTSEDAEIIYKVTDYYQPDYERCIIWNDPHLNISWPTALEPILSLKDSRGVSFAEATKFESSF